ncbi:unnamed protein product [Cylicocyclus nassatus]|uniref:Uncharacterized protein n=1 Tax=Cylicocyclus nassatus TaxID=53992 RepID=A0AA36M3J6_CYLNA|nr:unnamed protein product [Cylicocyclus nassatus]
MNASSAHTYGHPCNSVEAGMIYQPTQLRSTIHRRDWQINVKKLLKSETMPSDSSMYFAMIAFIFCLCIEFLGNFILVDSVLSLHDGLEQLPKQINVTSKGSFVSAFGENLHCNFDNDERLLRAETEQTIANIKSLAQSLCSQLDTSLIDSIVVKEQLLRTNMNKWKNSLNGFVGEMNVGNKLSEVDQVLNAKCGIIKHDLEETRNVMTDLCSEIKSSFNETDKHHEAIVSELSLYKDIIDGMLMKINTEANLFRVKTYTILEQENYVGKLGLSLLITILLPSVLIIFSLIGLFFLLVRYLADCFKESGEQKYAMRGWPSRLGACTLGFGGYIALTIAIVSIILLVVYFILAFTSMYICVGLFEDEELRVLFALPKQEIRIKIATRNITLTLHDTLYKCRNEYSFFDAINGEQIWAKKELKSKLSALRKTSFRRTIRNFQINETLTENLEALFLQLEPCLGNITSACRSIQPGTSVSRNMQDDCASLTKNLAEFVDNIKQAFQMLSLLSSRSRRDKFAKEVSDLMVQLEDKIVLRVANLLKSMNDLSPQCKALLSIWDDFGFYVCKIVATPAQGLWVACAVTAIGALAVYSALFKATAFLKRFEEDSEEEEVVIGQSSSSRSRTHKSSHDSRVGVRKSGSEGSAKRRSRKSKSKKARSRKSRSRKSRSRKSRSRKSKSKKHSKSAKKAQDMKPNQTLGESPAVTPKHQLRESAGRAPYSLGSL